MIAERLRKFRGEIKMINKTIRRGEIYYADLSPVIGLEQGGMRPVVIIQNDIGNRFAPTVNVVPITSQKKKTILPSHVKISSEESNLDRDCIILAEQVRTIDKRRLKEKIGQVSQGLINKIDKAISVQQNISRENPSDLDKKEELAEYYMYIQSELIAFMEEDLQHEFKEIKGGNPVNHINSNVGEYINSFLNSNGGTIFYGISDDMVVKGVYIDRKQKDEIRICINNAVNSMEPKIAPDSISIDFKEVYSKAKVKINDTYVIEVHVDKPWDEKEIYTYKNEIYVRVDGAKNKLVGHAIVDYIRKKTIQDYNLQIIKDNKYNLYWVNLYSIFYIYDYFKLVYRLVWYININL